MHFVPFPALSEVERIGGLATLDLAGLAHGPTDAVAAGRIRNVMRVRLLQRPDGPVYLLSGSAEVLALHAADLSDAAVHSQQLALAIAVEHARRRGLDAAHASLAGLSFDDQWTLPNGFDPHRPLYRVAVNDELGTELYVSSRTGEVVLETTRRGRGWNYLGSVVHWIYPAALHSHRTAWVVLVWWLSLLALIGAAAGAVVGVLRIGADGARLTPYRGWQAWHHRLGLMCMVFVCAWIFSGWLSMDDGRLFSTGQPTGAEAKALAGVPDWQTIPGDELQHVSAQAKEVEWFTFGGQIQRRERFRRRPAAACVRSCRRRQRNCRPGVPGTGRNRRGRKASGGWLQRRCRGRGRRRLPRRLDNAERAGLSSDVRQRLVSYRRSERRVAGNTRSVAAHLSLALSSRTHGGLSRVDETSGSARRADCHSVRMRICVQPDRRGYRVAPAGVVFPPFVIDAATTAMGPIANRASGAFTCFHPRFDLPEMNRLW